MTAACKALLIIITPPEPARHSAVNVELDGLPADAELTEQHARATVWDLRNGAGWRIGPGIAVPITPHRSRPNAGQADRTAPKHVALAGPHRTSYNPGPGSYRPGPQHTAGIMTTQTVVARGSAWSASSLGDGWGGETSPHVAEQLARLVTERFHETALAAGADVLWTPETSEVVGPLDLAVDAETLAEWREQAIEHVAEDFVNDALPLHYDGDSLFDLFVAHGVTTAQIAAQDLHTITRQVTELRADEPDHIKMSDDAIAQAILAFAIHDTAGLT